MMEQKLKHLEFIQNIINRMAHNSFVIKGWTVLLIAAIIAFVARGGDTKYVIAIYFAVAAFWILDGFFLSQERLFRALYAHVASLNEDDVNFSMDTRSYMEDRRNNWISAMFSRTLVLFYLSLGLVGGLIQTLGWLKIW